MPRIRLRCAIALIGASLALGGWANTDAWPVDEYHKATGSAADTEPLLVAQQISAHILTEVELDQFLRGKSLYFRDGGVAEYHTDQSYLYRRGTRTWKGTWQIEIDQVCKIFTDGRKRCDVIGFDGKYYYQIHGKGSKVYVTSIHNI